MSICTLHAKILSVRAVFPNREDQYNNFAVAVLRRNGDLMSVFKGKSAFSSAKNECRRINKKYIFFISLILLFIGFFTRWISGTPVYVIHTLGISALVPSIWIMVILTSLSYIVGGIALGSALGNRSCARIDKKYQGGMWFCIMASLSYVWYPIFFCSNLFFVSLIISLLCFFCALCATVCFAKVSRISFCSMLLYDLWLFYLFILNFKIFFTL